MSFRDLNVWNPDGLRNEIYGNKSSRVNQVLNGDLNPKDAGYIKYTSNGPKNGGFYNELGFTAHENFSLTKENLVPSGIHNPGNGGISHIGGIERLLRMVDSIPIIDRSIVRSVFVEGFGGFRKITLGSD